MHFHFAMRQRVRKLIPVSIRMQRNYMDWKSIAQYWFFQRLLRINSHVGWPVHWSSVIVTPEKVVLRSPFRPPGMQPGTYIQGINGIIVGENVWLAPGVKIVSADHDLCDYALHSACEPVEIGDNCWLGANSVILPGVKLGNHVVVAAGAVVSNSFPDNTLVAGVPARVIRHLGAYRFQRAALDAAAAE